MRAITELPEKFENFFKHQSFNDALEEILLSLNIRIEFRDEKHRTKKFHGPESPEYQLILLRKFDPKSGNYTYHLMVPPRDLPKPNQRQALSYISNRELPVVRKRPLPNFAMPTIPTLVVEPEGPLAPVHTEVQENPKRGRGIDCGSMSLEDCHFVPFEPDSFKNIEDFLMATAPELFKTLWHEIDICSAHGNNLVAVGEEYDGLSKRPVFIRHDVALMNYLNEENHSNDYRKGEIPREYSKRVWTMHGSWYPVTGWSGPANFVMVFKLAAASATFVMDFDPTMHITVTQESMNRKWGGGNAALAMEIYLLSELGYRFRKEIKDGVVRCIYFDPPDPSQLQQILALKEGLLLNSIEDVVRGEKSRFWTDSRKESMNKLFNELVAVDDRTIDYL